MSLYAFRYAFMFAIVTYFIDPVSSESRIMFMSASTIVALAGNCVNFTVGLETVTVPSAPAVAEPMFVLVVEPEAPPVPMFTVFVTPEPLTPVPTQLVDAAVAVPSVQLVPPDVKLFDAVSVHVTVTWPANVCARFAVVARVPSTLGNVMLRVVAVVIPLITNRACLVTSVASCNVNIVHFAVTVFVLPRVLFVSVSVPVGVT